MTTIKKTIEEKAKAYDEAIERANSLLSDNQLGNAWIYKLLPELKESEGDKMKKIISDILLIDSDEIRKILDSNNVLMQDIYAWLEKQGEKELVTCPICGWEIEKQGEQKSTVDTKVIIPKFRVGDIVKSKSQPMLSPRKIISIGKDCYWCEDRGCIGFAWEDDCEIVEQNPAWSEEDSLQLDAAINIVTNSGHTCTSDWLKSLKDRVQPKQEWSEKDNRMCKAIIDNIQAICEEGYFVGDIDSDELIKWLKSLRDRVQPQPKQEWSDWDKIMLMNIIEDENCPLDSETMSWLKSLKDRVLPNPKQEWSEEDEEMHRKCICAMRASACGFPEEEKFVEQVNNWINFLKSQRQWKPSDEQLRTLELAIDYWKPDDSKITGILYRLWEQLKKLKA